MSVAVSSQDLLPDQIADLESRLRKLAEDKSNLQLVIRLIERINPLPGVEDMIRSLLASIVETIGGTNIKLYYWIGSELHCTDFAGHNVVLAEIDDPVAARVARSRSFIEERGNDADTLLTKEQVAPGAWIWAFPLIVGADLVGIVKIENLHISGASLRTVLPIFFSHAALILSNEIRNFTRQHPAALEEGADRPLAHFHQLRRTGNQRSLRGAFRLHARGRANARRLVAVRLPRPCLSSGIEGRMG
jgi:hypothetical protein